MGNRSLHVATGLGIGGAEALLIEVVNESLSRGDQPVVASLRNGDPLAKELRERGVQVHELGARADRLNLRALFRLAQIIRRHDSQIIQAWMYHANVFCYLACLMAARRPSKSLLFGIFNAQTDFTTYGASTRLVAKLGAFLSRRVAGVIYNAERAAHDHQRAGYSSARTLTIRNGVDTVRFQTDQQARKLIRDELSIPHDAVVAIVAGRVHPQKDWPGTLAGLRNVQEAYVIAAGMGTEALPEQDRLIRLGIRRDMPALYAAADFFVLASAFGEGTSIAMAEAMSCGLPVIVTDIGDNARYAQAAGFVVPVGDPDALTRQARLLAVDAQLRAELGRQARQCALSEFSRAASYQPLFEFYDRLVAN